MDYRDSATLQLAKEINDFVRSRTTDPTVAEVALEAARATLSFVPWPPLESREYPPSAASALSVADPASE